MSFYRVIGGEQASSTRKEEGGRERVLLDAFDSRALSFAVLIDFAFHSCR